MSGGRLHATTRSIGRSTGTWLTEHPRARKALVSLACVGAALGIVLVIIVFGAVADYTKDRINEARARQVWALVAVGAGDPVELSRWASWGACEATRQGMVRRSYERHGVAPAVRCEGVKSWLELLKETEKR